MVILIFSFISGKVFRDRIYMRAKDNTGLAPSILIPYKISLRIKIHFKILFLVTKQIRTDSFMDSSVFQNGSILPIRIRILLSTLKTRLVIPHVCFRNSLLIVAVSYNHDPIHYLYSRKIKVPRPPAWSLISRNDERPNFRYQKMTTILSADIVSYANFYVPNANYLDVNYKRTVVTIA